MDSSKIGTAAGAVWTTLHEAPKGCTMSQIKNRVKKSDGYTADEVAAAIGWLAREDKLILTTQGRKTVVTLAEGEFAQAVLS
ncbi:MAG: winged helix-turn-helix domain-containing protein [Planctomycetota bacterium]